MSSASAFSPLIPPDFEPIAVSGEIAFAKADASWEEHFDLIASLQTLLAPQATTLERQGEWLLLNGEFYLHPVLTNFKPIEPQGVQISLVVVIAHPKYLPQSLFEYQHACGDDMNQAIASGLGNWLEYDLPVLLDAIAATAKQCDVREMTFGHDGSLKRRAVLGPVLHDSEKASPADEDHPFGPCCLLTNTFDAFQRQFESEQFYGIRLLVVRNSDGRVSADCRINGIDWPVGQEQLIEYGKTWPNRGFEMRKQYVVICNGAVA